MITRRTNYRLHANGFETRSFQDSEATVGFIRQIDRAFDMLNTRTPFAHGFERPVLSLNINQYTAVLKSTAEYLLTLRSSTGQLLALSLACVWQLSQ
jgi:hypothetical protein